MHVSVLSLFVAIAACGLLLVAFGLFTMTPHARRMLEDEHRREQLDRRLR
jgi:hypothetical protein